MDSVIAAIKDSCSFSQIIYFNFHNFYFIIY